MKNKRGDIAVIAIIIMIVAITAGIVGWLFAKKSQAPVQQAISQPAAVNTVGASKESILPSEINTNQNACNGTSQVVDSRDNQIYQAVAIGSQCWFNRNLNIGKMIKGINVQKNNKVREKYCNADDEKNCDKYGGLYQWDEAMRYSTSKGSQGICPNGWHIASDKEWSLLETFLTDAGQSCDNNRQDFSCVGAGTKLRLTNIDNFNLVFGGNRSTEGTFNPTEIDTTFWTSAENFASGAWNRSLNSDNPSIGSSMENNGISLVGRADLLKSAGLSIRCVKN